MRQIKIGILLMMISAAALAGPPPGWHIYTPPSPPSGSGFSGASIHIGK